MGLALSASQFTASADAIGIAQQSERIGTTCNTMPANGRTSLSIGHDAGVGYKADQVETSERMERFATSGVF
jgi:hypothetical protein